MKRKSLISKVLIMVMALSMMMVGNVQVFAGIETGHNHDSITTPFPSINGCIATQSNLVTSTDIAVSDHETATACNLKSGKYYLHEDVNLNYNIVIASESDVTICLNGHSITPSACSTYINPYPMIENNGKLTICDCKENASDCTHYFAKENDCWIATDTSCASATSFNGGVIACTNDVANKVVDNKGTLELKSGSIAFNNCIAINTSSSLKMSGGKISHNTHTGSGIGVNVGGGTFEMTGGEISYNTSKSNDGGGVCVGGGTFEMTGGIISHNKAKYNGGGVFIKNASFFMSGNSRIVNNGATDGSGTGYGGGICLDGGYFQMTNDGETPEISNNYARNCGGGIQIKCCSATNIIGGKITGNNTGGDGGGIYISPTGSCKLQDATITNNKSAKNGAGVYFERSKTCFIKGTKITMADGSKKNIEDVKVGDIVRTFNHDTGKVSTEKIWQRYESEEAQSSFTLHFSNDIKLGVVGCHGFFVKEYGKYVNITEENVQTFIGKHFYNADSKKWEELKRVSTNGEKSKYYSLYSAHHINCVANHILTVTDDAIFTLNVFDMDENMKYDAVKKQADIDKYGLTKYEDISEYIDWDTFDNGNNQYDHIAVCKGLITLDELLKLAREDIIREENESNSTLMSVGDSMPLSTRNTATLAGTGNTALLAGSNEEIEPQTAGTLIIGSNVSITNNKKEATDSNLYLESGKVMSIIQGSSNINIGVTAQKEPVIGTPTSISEEIATPSDTIVFTSDNPLFRVAHNVNDCFELYAGALITYKYNDNTTHDDYEIATAIPTSLPTPTRSGYSFKGWFTNEGLTTEATPGAELTTDTNLYAKWESDTPVTPPTTSATIEFDSNGGEGAMSSKTIVQGSELTLPECTMTAPFGQQFAGWKVGDKTYAAGDKITVMSSMKIQAIWVDIPEAPYVVAKASALGKKALKLSWTECKGAAEYVIYANKCNAKGKQYKMKKIATTARSSYKLAKLSGKALKANTFYKMCVVALDENGEEIARSAVMHAATGNYKGKLGNPVKIVAKDAEMELLVGESGNADVKALRIYKDKALPASHAAGFRYVTSNPNIATVDSEGLVTGVKAGACKIYIQAANGLWAEIELTVKNK